MGHSRGPETSGGAETLRPFCCLNARRRRRGAVARARGGALLPLPPRRTRHPTVGMEKRNPNRNGASLREGLDFECWRHAQKVSGCGAKRNARNWEREVPALEGRQKRFAWSSVVPSSFWRPSNGRGPSLDRVPEVSLVPHFTSATFSPCLQHSRPRMIPLKLAPFGLTECHSP